MAKEKAKAKASKQEILGGLMQAQELASEEYNQMAYKCLQLENSKGDDQKERDALLEKMRVKQQESADLSQKALILTIEIEIQKAISKGTVYLPLIKNIIDENKGTIADLIAMFITTGVDVGNSLDEPMNKVYALSAKRSKGYYDALIKAKFTSEQAMTLLLASTKSPISFMTEIFKGFSADSFTKGMEAASKLRRH